MKNELVDDDSDQVADTRSYGYITPVNAMRNAVGIARRRTAR